MPTLDIKNKSGSLHIYKDSDYKQQASIEVCNSQDNGKPQTILLTRKEYEDVGHLLSKGVQGDHKRRYVRFEIDSTWETCNFCKKFGTNICRNDANEQYTCFDPIDVYREV